MKRIALLLLLVVLPSLVEASEARLELRYVPSGEDLTEEALAFDVRTHGVLVGWELIDLKNVLKNGAIYGEEATYRKGERKMKVVVLEFSSDRDSKYAFELLKAEWPDQYVASREFGDEGFIVSEKSWLTYRDVFRINNFVVSVEPTKEVSLYETKMMARWVMFRLHPIVEKELGGLTLFGPLKISNYQFYPYLTVTKNGAVIRMFDYFVPKNILRLILIIAVVAVFVVAGGLIFAIYLMRGRAKENLSET